jgi:hypothetical protein
VKPRIFLFCCIVSYTLWFLVLQWPRVCGLLLFLSKSVCRLGQCACFLPKFFIGLCWSPFGSMQRCCTCGTALHDIQMCPKGSLRRLCVPSLRYPNAVICIMEVNFSRKIVFSCFMSDWGNKQQGVHIRNRQLFQLSIVDANHWSSAFFGCDMNSTCDVWAWGLYPFCVSVGRCLFCRISPVYLPKVLQVIGINQCDVFCFRAVYLDIVFFALVHSLNAYACLVGESV